MAYPKNHTVELEQQKNLTSPFLNFKKKANTPKIPPLAIREQPLTLDKIFLMKETKKDSRSEYLDSAASSQFRLIANQNLQSVPKKDSITFNYDGAVDDDSPKVHYEALKDFLGTNMDRPEEFRIQKKSVLGGSESPLRSPLKNLKNLNLKGSMILSAIKKAGEVNQRVFKKKDGKFLRNSRKRLRQKQYKNEKLITSLDNLDTQENYFMHLITEYERKQLKNRRKSAYGQIFGVMTKFEKKFEQIIIPINQQRREQLKSTIQEQFHRQKLQRQQSRANFATRAKTHVQRKIKSKLSQKTTVEQLDVPVLKQSATQRISQPNIQNNIYIKKSPNIETERFVNIKTRYSRSVQRSSALTSEASEKQIQKLNRFQYKSKDSILHHFQEDSRDLDQKTSKLNFNKNVPLTGRITTLSAFARFEKINKQKNKELYSQVKYKNYDQSSQDQNEIKFKQLPNFIQKPFLENFLKQKALHSVILQSNKSEIDQKNLEKFQKQKNNFLNRKRISNENFDNSSQTRNCKSQGDLLDFTFQHKSFQQQPKNNQKIKIDKQVRRVYSQQSHRQKEDMQMKNKTNQSFRKSSSQQTLQQEMKNKTNQSFRASNASLDNNMNYNRIKSNYTAKSPRIFNRSISEHRKSPQKYSPIKKVKEYAIKKRSISDHNKKSPQKNQRVKKSVENIEELYHQ